MVVSFEQGVDLLTFVVPNRPATVKCLGEAHRLANMTCKRIIVVINQGVLYEPERRNVRSQPKTEQIVNECRNLLGLRQRMFYRRYVLYGHPQDDAFGLVRRDTCPVYALVRRREFDPVEFDPRARRVKAYCSVDHRVSLSPNC